jgi:UDP-galactopyranose mutase
MAPLLPDPGAHLASDLVCLTHLRWSWGYQRPQHLMTRAARDRRVRVFEEPFEGAPRPVLDVTGPAHNVLVGTPRLPGGLTAAERTSVLRDLLDTWLLREGVRDFTLWYYTPMALPFAAHLDAACVVYDCMDELSGFAGAPSELGSLEQQLFSRCDIVFTGGHSLHDAKRRHHREVHAVPSSVDVTHFRRARGIPREPQDQASIPRPRLGYCGVIDERIDLELLRAVSSARPSWQFVFVGPVTKIDPSSLPQGPNLHYLGGRPYDDLPSYLSGWDVALLPFAHNESTRFISPTKTPEYLAAGRRVVSTSVRDVVRMFGESGFLGFGDTPAEFMAAVEAALGKVDPRWQERVDHYLALQSWDRTWARMQALMARSMSSRPFRSTPVSIGGPGLSLPTGGPMPISAPLP